MKYSEYRSKSSFKGSTAFYIIIACCLLALGGASWFAAANIKKRSTDNNSGTSSYNSDYSSPESSIISEPPIQTSSEEAGKTVSDEPYTSEDSASSKVESGTQAVVFSMPVGGEVIKDYSEKQLQYSATYGDMRIHTGIDIACEDGTSVSAAGDGKVTAVEESALLGTTVTIDHGNGIVTKYAALKDIKVKEGDTVTAGDIIGTVTAVPSECADQSHLHFEVFKNGHSAAPLSTLGLD
ncbi:MAG: peptidoglycan DD-metalloendopeptidase family protein [Acutalibacteraceae bacterium]